MSIAMVSAFPVIAALVFLVATQAHATVGVSFAGSGRWQIANGGGSTCIDGVNCYCDSPAYTSDASKLFCEDFETADLYLDTGPTGHSWYKSPSGFSTYRGGDSYWTNRYGGSGANNWRNGDPSATPYLGTVCAENFCAVGEYCSTAQGAGLDDCWGPGTNDQAPIDIQRTGDFDAEIPTLTLVGGHGASPDIGAGNASFSHRLPIGSSAGVLGSANLGGLRSQVGISFLVAYSSNFADRATKDDPFDGYLKHEEWGTNADFGAIEHWYMGRLNVGDDERIPFRPTQLTTGTSACNAALAGATVHVGATPSCQGSALYYSPPTSGTQPYVQSRDFPWGTWGCVRAWRNVSGGLMEVKVWFNEVLIIWISGFDASALRTPAYEVMAWNWYSNLNEDDPNGNGIDCEGTECSDDTDEPFYRYMDNVHIRAGDPVSCATVSQ